MEAPSIALTVVPSLGSRIASLVDTETEYEWLIGADGPPIDPPPYGSVYVKHDFSGWDEMLPTIDPCTYPTTGPFRGRSLPDHGDLWALPWSVEYENGHLITRAEALSLPLALTRVVTLTRGKVELAYRLENLGDIALYWLWAAHPLFTATPHTKIVLPREVKHIVEIDGSGNAQSLHPWPPEPNEPLDRLDFDIPPMNHKLFVEPDTKIGWARLEDGNSGSSLALSWTADVIPYLGIWKDSGEYTEQGTIALEPMSAYYDSLESAVEHGRAPLLPPGEVAEWKLTVNLAANTR